MRSQNEQQASVIRKCEGVRMLREKQVKDLTGLSRVTRWRMERRGDFPKKIQLSERCVGWNEGEVLEWLQKRMDPR